MDKHGWVGVDRMSPQVLQDAATMLDRLADDRCESGVVALRERMASVLGIAPERPSGPQVQEASFTDFMEIDREWEQRLRAAAPIATDRRYDAAEPAPGSGVSNAATNR
jgi:hypothetical protein